LLLEARELTGGFVHLPALFAVPTPLDIE
jgi:hypothetical protein